MKLHEKTKPKVAKVTYNTLFGAIENKAYILFDDGRVYDGPIEERHTCIVEPPEDVANRRYVLSTEVMIVFGGKEYKRSINLHCDGQNREILKTEDTKNENVKRVTFLIDNTEWRGELLSKIEEMEKDFYLAEYELLAEAHSLLQEEYNWVHFRRQVEIDGCVADGLAFVNHTGTPDAKIIGFEVKTNRDNYLRLHSQINSYLSICDEVYLIIEDKKIPRDLPFYVGVLQVQDGTSKVLRHAVSLKHSIDAGEFWKNLLKNLCSQVGVKRETPLINFFNMIENIKRKLIWNQFVIGWHQTYVKEYVQLTDDEKKLIRLFFGELEKCEGAKSLAKILTLDHWADNPQNPVEKEVENHGL